MPLPHLSDTMKTLARVVVTLATIVLLGGLSALGHAAYLNVGYVVFVPFGALAFVLALCWALGFLVRNEMEEDD